MRYLVAVLVIVALIMFVQGCGGGWDCGYNYPSYPSDDFYGWSVPHYDIYPSYHYYYYRF